MRHSLKAILLFFISVSLYGQNLPGTALSVTGIPPIPDRIIQRTNQYLNVRSAYFLDWEKGMGTGIYISTRFGNTSQVHYIFRSGGARQQLTFFNEPIGAVQSDPRENRRGFLFSKDVGGGESYQIFYFDRMNGSYHMLTDGRSRNSSALWARRGSMFAFSSNRRNGRDTDVWIMNPDKPEQAWALTTNRGSWYPVTWSPDDSSLVVMQYISANETHLYIADITTRNLKEINPGQERKIYYGGAVWSSDGFIYYVSDQETEFRTLYRYDPASGDIRHLTPDLSWDVESFDISTDGKYLAFSVNENGISKLHIIDVPEWKELETPDIPPGLISGITFKPFNPKFAFTLNAATAPADVYTTDITGKRFSRWTKSEVGGLNEQSFVTPSLIQYPTFDLVDGKRRTIPCFYYKPKKGTGPFPVIISIHGGPESQYRPRFSSTFQYWINELGCAVLAPNVRGSSGYGKTYLGLDNGFNRENTVKDIGALLDWIATQPELDADRVAVFGGSYGGYMVLSSLFHYPDRIACGVDIVGISNFVTFLENTREYRRDLRRVEYGDERNPKMRAFLDRISPATNAGKIRSPLFVAQGENDPRVPASEARQIVRAVEKNGIPVWTMFAADEGHGFRKKTNRDYFMRATILFFEEYLLK